LEEKDAFQEIAKEENKAEPTEAAIPRECLIRRIVANEDANVCTFYDFFKYYTIWKKSSDLASVKA